MGARSATPEELSEIGRTDTLHVSRTAYRLMTAIGKGALEPIFIMNCDYWLKTMNCHPRKSMSIPCTLNARIFADGNASNACNPLASCDLITLQYRKLSDQVS